VVMFQTFLYSLFLVFLSLALGLGAKLKDPTEYNNDIDRFRAVCEIFVILFTIFYLLQEAEQYFQSPRAYIKAWRWNLLDVSGLISILILLPCRYAESFSVERSISTFAFLINFVRIFRFFIAYEEYGIYVQTLARIIVKDVSKFAVIFVIIWIAFAGSVYLALSATNGFDEDFQSIWDILLQELRAMIEGVEFADSYSKYHVAFILFLMLNMFVIIIILSNVLIGQISYRYERAQEEASFRYDIEKTRSLGSIDRSILFHRLRMKHYSRGLFVSDEQVTKDLLMDWKTLHDLEENDIAIRNILEKRILKFKRN